MDGVASPGVGGPVKVAALALLAAGGAGLAMGLHATRAAPYRPVLRRIRLAVPATWPDISILHLSDLHVKAGDDRLHRAQRRFLSSLDATPDLVCVTGDICEQAADAPRAADLLRLVQPRLGTILVLGNHEHDAPPRPPIRVPGQRVWMAAAGLAGRFSGVRPRSNGTAEARQIAEVLAGAGFRVLANESTRLDVGGRPLWVAGVDSVWAGLARSEAALLGIGSGDPVLGLVHEPEGAIGLVSGGADLVLAGHTHGGQVVLPLLGAPVTWRVDPRIEVAAGVQRLGPGLLHISAGLGHTTPLRFRCPPEATWLNCVPVPAGTRHLPRRAAQPNIGKLLPQVA